jgi:hypothetical protein
MHACMLKSFLIISIQAHSCPLHLLVMHCGACMHCVRDKHINASATIECMVAPAWICLTSKPCMVGTEITSGVMSTAMMIGWVCPQAAWELKPDMCLAELKTEA